MPDDDPSDSNNPFIRFKHHVDANVHAGLNTIAGISRTTTTNTSSSSPSPSPDSHSTYQTPPRNSSNPTPQPHSYNPTSGRDDDDDNSTVNVNMSVPPSLSNLIPILAPPDPNLESRIALLAGTALPEAASAARRLFLSRSAYSPLRLHRELGVAYGCHPVPRDKDLPINAAAASTGGGSGGGGEFGWLEAYEDLLRVSSGLGLADLEERRGQRQRERCGVQGLGRSGWGWGWGWGWHDGSEEMGWLGRGGGSGGAGTWWWMDRLRRQGLWEAVFPVWDPEAGYRSPRTMEEWVVRRREEDAARERWAQEGRRWKEHREERQRRREEQEKEAEAAWREVEGEWERWLQDAQRDAKRELDDVHREVERARDALEDAAGRGSGFLGGIEGVVKALGKVLSDEVGSLQGRNKPGEQKPREDADADKTNTPETEGDLYSAVRSAFHESERSLSNLFKSVSDGWREGSMQQPKPVSPPKTETAEVVENGITKKTTKTEFVDEYGNTHNKIETTWTDEDGRVVMRQVQSSTGRSERWEKTVESATPTQESEAVEEPKEHKKEGGWFWK